MPLRAFTAALALSIGVAIVWVVIASSDDPGAAQRVTSPPEKKAVRLERKLAENPNDEKLQLDTMKAWIRAGADHLESIDTRVQPIPNAAPEDYKAGLRAWNDYLKQTDGEASRATAETAGVTYFQLVEIGSGEPSEAKANAAGALRAQKIVCRHEPNLYTLSDLAIYQYFNGEYAAGDRAARKAATDISKAQAKGVIDQLNEYKERGEKFVARVQRGEEELRETGDEELNKPIKGYGSHAGLNGYEPGTKPGA